MADTAFEEGAGVVKVPGGVAQKFRALLVIVDRQSPIERKEDENSPLLRCARKVQCCSSAKETDPSYILAVEGPINVATQLLTPRKGDVFSALVTWRSTKEMTLLSLAPVTEQGTDLEALKKFFVEEVNFYKDDSKAKVISMPEEATPTKRHLAAIQESSKVTTPETWIKRNRTDADPKP